jgi:hypothetical protein
MPWYFSSDEEEDDGSFFDLDEDDGDIIFRGPVLSLLVLVSVE